MAMASAISCSLSTLAISPASTSAARDSLRSCSSSSLCGGRLRITSVKGCRLQSIERRNVVIKATAAEGAAPEPVAEPAAAAVEAPASPISELKLQSDILKKLAKKAELKRKRLVRKRHLRKKGRWPPSKMTKNQNV